jgi:hypothetical protein
MVDFEQRLYNLNFVFGAVVCGALAGIFLLSSLSLANVDNVFMRFVLMVLVALFLPLNLSLYFRSRKRNLIRPPFMSLRLHNYLSVGLIGMFLTVIAYGLYVWPYAPLEAAGSTFTDKLGNQYTAQQFISFRKWEVALITVGGIFAIFAMISLPFQRGRLEAVDGKH